MACAVNKCRVSLTLNTDLQYIATNTEAQTKSLCYKLTKEFFHENPIFQIL